MSAAQNTPVVTYEVFVTLSYDTKQLTYMTHYFFNIEEAYVCYQEFMCELGKNFSVIEIIEAIEVCDEVSIRLLDRVTDDGCVRKDVMKSLESIIKDLETPVSDCEREKELQRTRENTEGLAEYTSEESEVKRKGLCKILRHMEDTKNKRERCKYDSLTFCEEEPVYDIIHDSRELPSEACEAFDRFKFANIVYDVRKMPDEIFDLFFKEMMMENANRENFKRVRATNSVV
jgi:hypothetical protein